MAATPRAGLRNSKVTTHGRVLSPQRKGRSCQLSVSSQPELLKLGGDLLLEGSFKDQERWDCRQNRGTEKGHEHSETPL